MEAPRGPAGPVLGPEEGRVFGSLASMWSCHGRGTTGQGSGKGTGPGAVRLLFPWMGAGRGGHCTLGACRAESGGCVGEASVAGLEAVGCVREVQFSISSQEELKHFEVKIEKHNHYQKQLEISHQKLKHVESFGDQEHVARNKERYAMLEEKTKELGYKVGVWPPAGPPELIRTHGAGGGCTALGFGAGLWDRGLTGLPTTPPPRPRLRAPHQVTSKRFGVATPTGAAGRTEPGSSSCTGGTCAPPLVLSDLHPRELPGGPGGS